MMPICEHLEWDSRFFGRRVARSNLRNPKPAEWTDIIKWCETESVDCLYFLTDVTEAAAMTRAAANNFVLVDLRITLDRQVDPVKRAVGLRVASRTDIPALQAMVCGAYPESRFSRDLRFAPDADRFYKIWIQRNVEGYADQVLVAEDNAGQPAGFVSCHKRPTGEGEIGLTGVREDMRGIGIGAKLVTSSLAWFSDNSIQSAFVVTNGGNITAQRLYQRHGFFTRKVEVWFHRWFKGGSDEG